MPPISSEKPERRRLFVTDHLVEQRSWQEYLYNFTTTLIIDYILKKWIVKKAQGSLLDNRVDPRGYLILTEDWYKNIQISSILNYPIQHRSYNPQKYRVHLE